ncbi:MAG TPA: ACT domain-containing protein [Deltaproteobacteria bacterium]|nr:ACT domain-containing protein [Deltaproteobacteria bacterium]HPJ94386.1 ACT domain-containing protein [Deltaproteobacteria bacterium]HPR52165.1 ACT domain-containing protein [Deltaproteobacteria bacterium]
MKLEQISIFLENKPGGLSSVTKALRDANINIRALSLADTSDFGILRLIVNDVAKAKEILNASGFAVGRTNVVAVEVPDKPGGLHSILEALTLEGVNVEYMYAFVERSGENAVIIFRFDSTDSAIRILQEKGFKVLPGEKVYGI